ncbi:MAG: Nif3-like dinuclear metal center hexameric protein [Ignavibacteria bacterium RBG_16_34_14]|nr:MAG: Nif3-like dinuclear metal center hexameric protein [Ignavibacteria bacterium RBG_16_34_14]
MTCEEIFKYIENWAPKEIAWNKDNVGLQVGSSERKVKNILLSLDLNMRAVNEAINKNCNLIITHHPMLFNPIRTIDTDRDKNSLLVEKLLRHDITLFSAHTNLDFTKDGVSFQLAKTLKLKNIRFLANLKSKQYKLVIFVPDSHFEKVANAIFENGGGNIGEYSHCGFRTKGEGSFKGSEKTSPSIGKKLNYERVDEIKLEVLIDSWKLEKILSEVKKVHPYEEIAYDVYPLNNEHTNYGVGAIGETINPMNQDEFLDHISKCLKIKNFRYTGGKGSKIKTVAVCGGSGSEFISNAIKEGANAYITADIKYHTFFENEDQLLLIDAGHYETEIFSLNELNERLTALTKENKIKVFKYSRNANPVNFYNNSGA